MVDMSCELKDDQAMRCDAMHSAGSAAAAVLCDRTASARMPVQTEAWEELRRYNALKDE